MQKFLYHTHTIRYSNSKSVSRNSTLLFSFSEEIDGFILVHTEIAVFRAKISVHESNLQDEAVTNLVLNSFKIVPYCNKKVLVGAISYLLGLLLAISLLKPQSVSAKTFFRNQSYTQTQVIYSLPETSSESFEENKIKDYLEENKINQEKENLKNSFILFILKNIYECEKNFVNFQEFNVLENSEFIFQPNLIFLNLEDSKTLVTFKKQTILTKFNKSVEQEVISEKFNFLIYRLILFSIIAKSQIQNMNENKECERLIHLRGGQINKDLIFSIISSLWISENDSEKEKDKKGLNSFILKLYAFLVNNPKSITFIAFVMVLSAYFYRKTLVFLVEDIIEFFEDYKDHQEFLKNYDLLLEVISYLLIFIRTLVDLRKNQNLAKNKKIEDFSKPKEKKKESFNKSDVDSKGRKG